MTLTPLPSLAISKLSEQNQRRICRLLAHRPPSIDLRKYSSTRQAAVLILLFETEGELRVLLTTRAKTLRTHPGQTALPGGAKDDSDASLVDTAYREAMEEVGLPLDHPNVHTLCFLRPFIAWTRSFVLVTPVVALLTDPSVLSKLRPAEAEVDLIFDHPLFALLDPSTSKSEPLVALNSELWPSSDPCYNYADSQWAWMGNSTYRLHRFRTAAAAIKGLTADVLEASWIPVDAAARTAVDMLRSSGSGFSTYHLAHPRPVHWRTLFAPIAQALGLQSVTYEAWLQQLRNSSERSRRMAPDREVEELQRNPALKLIEHFEEMHAGGAKGGDEASEVTREALGLPKLSVARAVQVAPSLSEENLPQLTAKDAMQWVQYWKSIQYLQ
ncbi:uncharacterized protein PHACADRAFT_213085 [Phanerochaete carnosa HHB-10118-sp]|uniref:Nudix hydrolase domain-containing protein n=1 Tax=Phanerochaete carnosa (strain HHB-10118-sp) TaxID=650164 RepID=K5WLP7_PHACS|nr:uncharacterized protein PHACADRAFT_213085 [Phanerochaete carnosa HHB-10118-sp]EKM51217.1 hypothetical protein PHACADRAFT_213085 [Phanerochaete carnosa HHB-10118-sp]